MSDLTTPQYQLDEEQLRSVRDCLRKSGFSLPKATFERFVRGIEDSIARFSRR
jgi:histone H3/H4